MSGNRFYDAVEENVWVSRKKKKQVLNFHKSAVDRIRELEGEVANMKTMFRKLHEKNESKQKEIDRLNAEVKSLLHEIVKLKREIEALQRENEIEKQLKVI